MANQTSEIKRWVLIEASPEVVFNYLADLSIHGEWQEYERFVVVGITQGSVVEGSFCQRERIETFQAPVLRGGGTSNQVIWTKILTVVGYEPNYSLDFETKNLYNGISIGSELISFRLFPEGSMTLLAMFEKKNPHLPGLFHVLMKGAEHLKYLVSQPAISTLFRLFPWLRVNSKLRRIKNSVERA